MENKPFFSIVVPTLNEEKRIEDELRKIRELAPEAELIVADGWSADKTREIAEGLANKVVLEGESPKERKSIGAGRNRGAKEASTEIIVFIDADTLPQKRFFHRMLKAFEDPRVVCYGCKIMPRDVGFADHMLFEFFNILIFFSAIMGRPAIAGNCVAYRKSAFDAIKGFDEEMQASEDQDLCVRISKLGKVVYDRHVIAFTSSRRLKKLGWFGLLLDWGRTTLNFLLGIKTKRYAIVREI
ncbi:glycosyltransferase [Candidatus Micrarchaeota archaeon]|nr:glycosyltransferase [Candidatus Micrarchaeota archaeon]